MRGHGTSARDDEHAHDGCDGLGGSYSSLWWSAGRSCPGESEAKP